MGDIKGAVAVSSKWQWEHWRKTGRNAGYYLEDAWEERNMVVDEGLTHLLDVVFSGGAAKSAWYIALFNDDHTPASDDTYQSPGYTESTNYSGPRQTWQEGGVSSVRISNEANVASFTMSATEMIYGSSLVSANTPGDSVSGEVLYCESKYDSSRGVQNEDVLKVTATLEAQDV